MNEDVLGGTCGIHVEEKGIYGVLVGRPESKRLMGIPRHRWEDNIKKDFSEVGIDSANRIRLAQDRVQ
jgi:hypothetical protein